MMLTIYNTLSKKKEEFKPLRDTGVSMYTCGVTVYDDCHLGHARSLYIFDLMRRYLSFRGYQVTWVRNITDIDDKIINRANESKRDWKELVTDYISRYYQDLEALQVDRADIEPRATENISDMIAYISRLIAKGYAYEAGGDVYFDVRAFSRYGQLSGQKIEAMESGVRIDPSDLKKDLLDFALWKKSKEGEPSWESPWGMGRPGWHIECSVMSQKYLMTDTIDIHAGGRDLVFPHHENETAQAEALTDKPFARYWIHHGLLTINGQKMSKSLGNFITIQDFVAKHKDANLLKLFFLSVHYAHPIDFTEEKIMEAKTSFNKLRHRLMQADRCFIVKKSHSDMGALQEKVASKKFRAEVDEHMKKFQDAMDDDFNTAIAKAVLFDLTSLMEKHINPIKIEAEDIQYARKIVITMADVLGLSFKLLQEVDLELRVYIEQKIQERNEAGKAKDFQKADRIREELRTKGVILEDVKGWVSKPALEGTTWRIEQ
ncbi:MAG: cysteine--tRNA ligase [Candidatus Omnitrophota bacterium]